MYLKTSVNCTGEWAIKNILNLKSSTEQVSVVIKMMPFKSYDF